MSNITACTVKYIFTVKKYSYPRRLQPQTQTWYWGTWWCWLLLSSPASATLGRASLPPGRRWPLSSTHCWSQSPWKGNNKIEKKKNTKWKFLKESSRSEVRVVGFKHSDSSDVNIHIGPVPLLFVPNYSSSENHAVMFLPESVWRPSASGHSGLCWWRLVWSQTPCHRFFDLWGNLWQSHTRVRA